MNILLVSQYYYPEQFLINEIAPELVKKGHKVTVLTGLPNYPEGKVDKKYKLMRNRKQTIEGVKIIRCFEIGRRKSNLFLGLNYLSFAVSASLKTLFTKEKFDVVFCYQMSPVTMALPAIIYKFRKKVKLFLYCCDIFPESVKGHVKSDKSLFYKMVSVLSKYIYNQCDHVAVSSKPFIGYLSEINDVDKSRMSYLPQHANNQFLNQDLSVPDENTVDFLFAGNIGYGQSIETIINAVELIKDIPGYVVHIVGDGSRLSHLKEMVKRKELEKKFIFHGRYPASEMYKFYKHADACLLTLRSNNFVGMTMPSKLQTYMTTGKPILGAINGAAQEVINESQCGSCVNAGDEVGLAELMRDFICHRDKYKYCGENGKEFFKRNFTKEIYIEKIEKIMEQLTLGGKRNV